MAARPVVTEELVRRIDHVAGEFMLGWLRGYDGVRLERFGGVWAPISPERPELDFVNRVVGLAPKDAALVDDIVGFYRAEGVRPWFELAPSRRFGELAERLTRAGAAQIGFYSALVGAAAGGARDERVRDLRHGEERLFADLRMDAYGVAGDRASIAQWAQRDGFRLFLAEVDGRPAATAVLVVSGGVGYLADATTLPGFRGRGLQTGLIRHRIAVADELGCDVVAALAEFDSSSQHNLERAGLQMAYTTAVWRVRERPSA